MIRLAAFVCLVFHVNSSVFIPQVDEMNLYASNQKIVNNISSIVEFVNEVILQNPDEQAEDHHKKRPCYNVFNLLISSDYCVYSGNISVKRPDFHDYIKNFSLHNEEVYYEYYLNIISPPPESMNA